VTDTTGHVDATDAAIPPAAPTLHATRSTPASSPRAPQRLVRPAEPPASETLSALPGPGDWVASQSQLRSALRNWLAAGGSRGSDVDVEQAEIILGADGRTAKTRLPVRVGAQIVIREQRWVQRESGWTIVQERQALP
jgi:hypothetical protein